jgi:hypothetical protein
MLMHTVPQQQDQNRHSAASRATIDSRRTSRHLLVYIQMPSMLPNHLSSAWQWWARRNSELRVIASEQPLFSTILWHIVFYIDTEMVYGINPSLQRCSSDLVLKTRGSCQNDRQAVVTRISRFCNHRNLCLFRNEFMNTYRLSGALRLSTFLSHGIVDSFVTFGWCLHMGLCMHARSFMTVHYRNQQIQDN